jgi:RNA polymerase sigma factor (sigma-70 family)
MKKGKHQVSFFFLDLFTSCPTIVLMNNEKLLISRLKCDDPVVIKKFYEENKKGFAFFASRYQLDQEAITDIYQDAVIALIENAKKGSIDDLKSNLSTYLFGIGKFMIYKKLKKDKRTVSIDDGEFPEVPFDMYEEEEINLQLALLRKGLKKLGEQCQKVLQLFYYEEKKLDEIQELLNYTNKDVLKSQKSRCLKQLKEIIKER